MDYLPLLTICIFIFLVVILIWVAKDIRRLINENKQSENEG